MKLYLAGSSADLDRARMWKQRLDEAGIIVTSTWIENIDKVGSANPHNARDLERLRWSQDDLIELSYAHVFWFIVPPIDKPTRGAWIELGYAYAARQVEPDPRMAIRLICSGDTKQSIFCALGTEFETDDVAFAHVLALAAEGK